MAIVCFSSDSTGTPREKSTVKTDSLDVHAESSADSKIVKTLKKGETVLVAYELFRMEGSWCAIVEEDKSPILGYVQCQYLEKKVSSRVWQLTGSRIIATGGDPNLTRVERTVAPKEKVMKPTSAVTAILYMTSWCPYCKKAQECLRSLGVNLIVYDIEKDKTKVVEMKEKGGSGAVPFIDIEGIHMEGYGEESIKNAVEKRRGL
jgi:glutaredoxin